MNTAKDNLTDEMNNLADRCERLGAMRERIRILETLEAEGSTGDFLELPWDVVLKIINPDAE